MNYEHRIVRERDGVDCFTPVEIDGSDYVTVILGLAFLTSPEEIIARGAERIVRVGDEYGLTNPRLEWEAPTPEPVEP